MIVLYNTNKNNSKARVKFFAELEYAQKKITTNLQAW